MSSLIPHPDVSHSQFQDLFDAALLEYNQKTGKDIMTDPLTARLLYCGSSDAVLSILQEQAHAFNQYRNGDWKVQLMRRLKPTVDILFGLSTGGVFGEGIGLVSLTNLKSILDLLKFILHRAELSTIESNIRRGRSLTCGMCISACLPVVLKPEILKAATGVSASYDALLELFECFEHYLGRLKVLTEFPSAVREILLKIMVELLEVLALATQQIKQGRLSEFLLAGISHLSENDAEKFARKLLGENDIEAVLQRLDRLTMEESRMTATQTMEVVYGLFNNMKVVMNGRETFILISPSQFAECFPRLDGKASIDHIREALGMISSVLCRRV